MEITITGRVSYQPPHSEEYILKEKASGRYLAFGDKGDGVLLQFTVHLIQCAYVFDMADADIRRIVDKYPVGEWDRIRKVRPLSFRELFGGLK
jgi:hypothetical protein